ncbi:hypothetical protein [Nonomuraea sp. NPDC050202]|uniref:hypothetical protein n=1 Tax=Nonomuraea sp. NPDC050202 TaxID=3155035 RepID=UPI0033C03583
MSQRTYDLEHLCQGACMNSYRRKVRTYEHAYAAYQTAHHNWRNDIAAWHAPMMWPTEPAEPAEPRLPYPVPGSPVYCSDCGYALKSKLSKLDGAACVYLRESDGLRGQSGEAKVSGSEESRSPSPTIDDLDDLDSWLRSWKAAYLGIDSLSRQGSLSDSISLGTAWLVVRAERILANPDIARYFGSEVEEWHAKLIRYDPSDVVVERLKGVRCPECKSFTLQRRVGDDKVTCGTPKCDRVLTLVEYRDLLEEVKKPRRVA